MNQYDEFGFEKSRQPGRLPLFIPFSKICQDTADFFPKFSLLLNFHLFFDLSSLLNKPLIRQLLSNTLAADQQDKLILDMIHQKPDLNALKEYVLQQQVFH